MPTRLPLLLTCTTLAGCGVAPGVLVYPAALNNVERIAAEYLVDVQPTLPLRASVVCLTNAMTQVEVVQMGIRNDLELTPKRRAILETIEDRPKAANCLAALGGIAA